MTGRERVQRALDFLPLDRAPRSPWALPGVMMFRGEEYQRLVARFPPDITGPGAGYRAGRLASGTPCLKGSYTDNWGSRFEVMEDGVIGEVKAPLFGAGYEALAGWQPPFELLEGVDLAAVSRHHAASREFVLAGTETRPFERMQFLRGTENLMMDIALDEPGFYALRDRVHAFNLAEMRLWAGSAVDGVSFMDDWGSQRALLISPRHWRKLFKPLYREYCDILHAAGKRVFFHSDGFIEDIYPDLVEIGVNAVNSQLFCMDVEKLGRLYAGKIAFWGEVDRQAVLPFGSQEEVRQAVRRLYAALCPDGVLRGVFAQCEWGVRDPEENINAVYDEWDRIAQEAGRRSADALL